MWEKLKSTFWSHNEKEKMMINYMCEIYQQLENSEFKLNNAAINVTFPLKLPLFSNKCISYSIWVIIQGI